MYLDDGIFIHKHGLERAARTTKWIVALFERLGFQVNEAKSILDPRYRLPFLGVSVWADALRFGLPDNKQAAIASQASRLLSSGTATPREVAALLGSINFARVAVPGKTRLATNALHLFRSRTAPHKAPHSPIWDRRLPIPPSVLPELRVWAALPRGLSRPVFDTPLSCTATLSCDASDTGWGAVFRRGGQPARRFGGAFSVSDRATSSSFRELLGLLFALQRVEHSGPLHVRLDSMVAVYYLRRGGGRIPELFALTQGIDSIRSLDTMQFQHVLRDDNKEADLESRRHKTRADWRLSPRVWRAAVRWFGQGTPIIDLFASAANRQVPAYIDRTQNALHHPWPPRDGLLYANPPFHLVGPLLRRLRWESRLYHLLLVLPVWPTRPWWTSVFELLVAPPQVLPPAPDLFLQDGEPAGCAPFSTIVVLVSNDTSTSRAFHAGQLAWQQGRGDLQLLGATLPLGGASSATSNRWEEAVSTVLRSWRSWAVKPRGV